MELREHPTLGGIFADVEGNIYTTRKNSGGNIDAPRLLSGTPDRAGYVVLSFTEGKRKAHRIVAETWIPNPDNLRVVHHQNHIKNDNRVCNLAWATYRQNTVASHARHPGVIQNVVTGEVIFVEDVTAFAKERGLNYSTLTSSRYQNYAHKGQWKYLGRV